MRRRLAALVALAGLLLSTVPGGPAWSQGQPESPAVAARFPDPPREYPTPGLQPGRDRWTDNAEMAAALRTLAGAGAATLIDLGRSETGAELLALRFSRGPGRPTALLVGQQHGNEPAGGEALLALAMQLANPAHPLSQVLDRLDVVVMPRVNPDGAALMRRTNAAGLDVNRDHLLLRTREADAVARLAAEGETVLFVDAHEHLAFGRTLSAFGFTKRHDLLVQYATTPNLPPALSTIAERDFRQPLLAALDEAGITHEWYYTNPRDTQVLRLSMGGQQPGIARNAGGLKNLVSVLLESRGFDLGRAHARRRVDSHVQALASLLRSAAAIAEPLRQQLRAIRAEVAGEACRGTLVLDAEPTPERRAITLLDAQTGADRTLEVAWDDALHLRPLAERARPCGYWLAGDATDAIVRLHRWGAVVRTLPGPRMLRVEQYRETARAGGEAGAPLRVTVEAEPGVLDAAPGSFYVPMDQPLANLIAAALEPDTAGSWFAQRVLPRLDAVQRVMSPP